MRRLLACILFSPALGAVAQNTNPTLEPATYTFSFAGNAHSKVVTLDGVDHAVLSGNTGVQVSVNGVQQADKQTYTVGILAANNGTVETTLDPAHCTLRLSNGHTLQAVDGDEWMRRRTKQALRHQAWSNFGNTVTASLAAQRSIEYSDNTGYRASITYTDQSVLDREQERQAYQGSNLEQRLSAERSEVLHASTMTPDGGAEGTVYFVIADADRKAFPVEFDVTIDGETFAFPQ